MPKVLLVAQAFCTELQKMRVAALSSIRISTAV
jgi:hypothetical protein